MAFLIGYLIVFLANAVNILVVTLIIASLTLIERKLLALVQRRMGPLYVGFKGRLQYLADALKMFIKGTLIPNGVNQILFAMMPTALIILCYSLYVNVMWGPNLSMIIIEYSIIYAFILSAIFGLCVLLTGFFTKNKYAILACIRTSLLTINLELFMGLFMLNVCVVSESFNLNIFVIYQEINCLFVIFFLIAGLLIILFLLEVNRAPFDLSEAESEIISGYHIEYGGFFFALYYLGEYLHLFFFSVFFITLFFSGWEINLYLNPSLNIF